MLVVLSGSRDSGKTTLCRALSGLAGAQGFALGGVLSPGVFSVSGEKTGFLCEDLASGASWLQGSRLETLAGPVYRAFTFSATGFQRANAACLAFLDAAGPEGSGLFIIDEIGPLELDYGEGFRPALDRLAGGGPRPALLSVRPELAGRLAACFAGWPLKEIRTGAASAAELCSLLLRERLSRG